MFCEVIVLHINMFLHLCSEAHKRSLINLLDWEYAAVWFIVLLVACVDDLGIGCYLKFVPTQSGNKAKLIRIMPIFLSRFFKKKKKKKEMEVEILHSSPTQFVEQAIVLGSVF